MRHRLEEEVTSSVRQVRSAIDWKVWTLSCNLWLLTPKQTNTAVTIHFHITVANRPLFLQAAVGDGPSAVTPAWKRGAADGRKLTQQQVQLHTSFHNLEMVINATWTMQQHHDQCKR
jgi:hypothetical protein